MIRISGKTGGGQLLRSSLTLACITGQPFEMQDIRSTRPRPGLMRQHLTCVEAAAAVCGAKVQGAERGSQDLRFTPGPIRGGDYQFDVGSGGSATLVFQTVLPALLAAREASTLTIVGGTHNPMAPPADFIEKCYLPVLRRMGAEIQFGVRTPGFMQAGGGVLQAVIEPLKQWKPLELCERGAFVKMGGTLLHAGLEESITQRIIASAAHHLRWDPGSITSLPAPSSPDPGGIIMLEAEFENITELCSCVAERGRRAESVGAQAAGQLKAWQVSGAPAGIHLADQLLLPLALAGQGAFTTFALSDHTLSHLALIPEFLPVVFRKKEAMGLTTISLSAGRD